MLASAGILKRERLQNVQVEQDEDVVEMEQIILIQSVTETIVPKLVADDVPLLTRYDLDICVVFSDFNADCL